MDKEKGEEVDITIDTSEDFESITLTIKAQQREVSIGLGLQEAQVLTASLNDALTTILLHKLNLAPTPPVTHH